MPQFPACPPQIKSIAHFLKLGEDHEERNLVVSYWSRMYACQVAMQLMPDKKPPEVVQLLAALMDWLEQTKKANADNDGITNETAAQALMEEYANQLFHYGNTQDHSKIYSKNVVKAFYNCGILLDVLQQFGPLNETFIEMRKYAKWKATHIHLALKRGEQPTAGPQRTVQTGRITNDNQLDDLPEDPLGTLLPPEHPTPAPPGFPMFNPATTKQFDFNDHSDDEEEEDVATPSKPSVQPAAQAPATPIAPPTQAKVPAQPEPMEAKVSLDAEQIGKAQKYCKWAESALNYDDVRTAVDNLEKALHLLKYGVEK